MKAKWDTPQYSLYGATAAKRVRYLKTVDDVQNLGITVAGTTYYPEALQDWQKVTSESMI